MKLQRSIVEFEGWPSWFLYGSETWGEYKMPVGRGAGGKQGGVEEFSGECFDFDGLSESRLGV